MSTPSITVLKLDDLWQVIDADCDTTVEQDIASGPCTLLSASVTTVASEEFFLFLYDDIAPTVGSDDPDEVFWFPQAGSSYVEVVPFNPPKGIYFENGLSFAGAQTDAQVTAPGSPVVVVFTLVPGEQ